MTERLRVVASLLLVEIAEAILLEMNQVLIGAESLRRIVDLVKQVAVMIFGLEDADFLIGR